MEMKRRIMQTKFLSLSIMCFLAASEKEKATGFCKIITKSGMFITWLVLVPLVNGMAYVSNSTFHR